nr:MAG TPA: hypothetical protein [Caudoviricetes sp.]
MHNKHYIMVYRDSFYVTPLFFFYSYILKK